jgi:hypothetical protein
MELPRRSILLFCRNVSRGRAKARIHKLPAFAGSRFPLFRTLL